MPQAPSCTRLTGSSRRSSLAMQPSSSAVTRPIAWLVAPLRWITS